MGIQFHLDKQMRIQPNFLRIDQSNLRTDIAFTLQPVDPALLLDTDVLALAGRIRLGAHEDFATSFPAGTPCRVTLDQGDGPNTMTVLVG